MPVPRAATPSVVVPRPARGVGSRVDDGPLTFFELPKDMAGRRSPWLPEPAAFALHVDTLRVLRALRVALADRLGGRAPEPIRLDDLPESDRALLDQLLGEGEVAARVAPEHAGAPSLHAQESVFAGVWRVQQRDAGRVVHDAIEVGAVPQALLDAARLDARVAPGTAAPPPGEVMNAPAVLTELRDRARLWRQGERGHVVNLTLLPLSPGDHAYLQTQLGTGRVAILSRGYGTCRVVNTRLARTWRVSYFNASDQVILDTVEVALVPEVACAATQDLEDSAERVAEVLTWAETS